MTPESFNNHLSRASEQLEVRSEITELLSKESEASFNSGPPQWGEGLPYD